MSPASVDPFAGWPVRLCCMPTERLRSRSEPVRGPEAHSSVPPVPGLPGEGDHLVPTLRHVA